MSDRKRPHNVLGEDEGSAGQKRPRGQSSAPSFIPPPSGGPPTADKIAAQIAAAKARAAQLTASRGQRAGESPTAGPATPAAPAAAAAPPKPAVPPLQIPAGPSVTDVQKKIAEIQRLVKKGKEQSLPVNPYLAAQQSKKAPTGPKGSGLNMAAHPLLADLTSPSSSGASTPTGAGKGKDKYKPMQPKFTSIKANARAATPSAGAATKSKHNPYVDPTLDEAALEGAEMPKERGRKQLKFVQPGKYTAIAEQKRKEAKLEELKQRIMESAKKAGIEAEFEVSEKAVRREPPPDVEWWDAPLLVNASYPSTSAPSDPAFASETKIRTPDSLITLYVQHPIPIPAPWDKNKTAPQDLKLTKKEMKKMRKQRRMAELQDRQDRVRMGLIPPDPPKVKLSNLMRVLTSDAVQDPTKIEARVRREMHQRKLGHEQTNEERKLTKEERHEKMDAKRAENEKVAGPQGAVFKIKYLSNPSHKFKVRKNAEQHGLSGCCIFNPKFSLVYVEGADKSVKAYKRLMLVRIDWTDEGRAAAAASDDEDEEGGEKKADGERERAEGEEEPQSLKDNKCELVWAGPIRERAFKTFRPKQAPTDSIAKDFLGPNLAGYWDTARAMKDED